MNRERRAEIMAEWRANQGERGAAGVAQVLRALEFIAGLQVANVRDGDRLRLTAKQLRQAQHRAISQARRAQHGPAMPDADTWWDQISAIAAGWGIATTREDWTSDKPAEPIDTTSPRYSATEAA